MFQRLWSPASYSHKARLYISSLQKPMPKTHFFQEDEEAPGPMFGGACCLGVAEASLKALPSSNEKMRGGWDSRFRAHDAMVRHA